MFKRYDLVIINRSFWPSYPVIGEGLLQLAESLAFKKKVAVIMQDRDGIKRHLRKSNRGNGVKFLTSWALTNSSSGLIKRVLDMLLFMIWVIICLIRTRPKNIYISTDPPVLIPFIVAIYSKIIGIKYIYHLQDIHPEITNITLKINSFLYRFLRKIDNFTMQNARLLITLNEIMKTEIVRRSNTQSEIVIIENPSVPLNINLKSEKKKGFSFTGNLGRLQRIPLLIDAINKYEKSGGTLNFEFAGGGIFSDQIKKLSNQNSLVKYHGFVSADHAVSISSDYEWALVPIEDEITRFAFPSKISSYICSGAKIIAICGKYTSVAKWVSSNQAGIVINPNIEDIVNALFKIENNFYENSNIILDQTNLKKRFQMGKFVENIKSRIVNL